jgi:hypothetical protein
MYIPITTAVLILLTVAMILIRIFWLRVPSRLRFFLIRASVAMIVLHALFEATKWNTTSDRLNALINWLAIAGYELLVLLFARLSPRWLTVPSAVILLIPLFASSIVFPLTKLFEPDPNKSVPIGNHLYYKVIPWANSGAGNAGVDLNVYYRPPFAPFLRHKLQTVAFNDQECNANVAFAVLGPTAKAVLGRCPHWPSEPSGTVDRPLVLH